VCVIAAIIVGLKKNIQKMIEGWDEFTTNTAR
jgi:hypothetical protein